MADEAAVAFNDLSDQEKRWLRARVQRLKGALADVPEPWSTWGFRQLTHNALGNFLMGLTSAESASGDWDDARGKGRRATLGQVFTPPNLARLMASLARVHLQDSGPRDVLDPACGAGSLLAAVVEARLDAGWSVGDALGHVEGWDRDPLAAWACRARLVLLAFEHRGADAPPSSLRIFAVDAMSKAGPAGLLRERRGRFALGLHAVIGNPPYLEAKRMGSAAPGLKQQLLARFPQLGGAFDLYLAFAYLGLEFLGAQGQLVLLVPNKITQSRYAARFRRDVF